MQFMNNRAKFDTFTAVFWNSGGIGEGSHICRAKKRHAEPNGRHARLGKLSKNSFSRCGPLK